MGNPFRLKKTITSGCLSGFSNASGLGGAIQPMGLSWEGLGPLLAILVPANRGKSCSLSHLAVFVNVFHAVSNQPQFAPFNPGLVGLAVAFIEQTLEFREIPQTIKSGIARKLPLPEDQQGEFSSSSPERLFDWDVWPLEEKKEPKPIDELK